MITDELSNYYADFLDGRYNCVDRVVLNAHLALCYSAVGFRTGWRRLHNGSEEELDNTHLMRMAGRFSRRGRGYAKAHGIPVIDCRDEERKHKVAEEHRKSHARCKRLFLILVGRAIALRWEVKRSGRGVIRNLEAKRV